MLLYFLRSCLQALLFFDVFFDLNLFNVVNDVVYVFGVRVLAEVCLLVRSTLARVLRLPLRSLVILLLLLLRRGLLLLRIITLVNVGIHSHRAPRLGRSTCS